LRTGDIAARQAVLEDLRATFTDVWEPSEGWVVGVDGLPGEDANPRELRMAGFVFAEGRDRACRDERDADAVSRLMRLALHSPERLSALPGDFAFVVFGRDGEVTAVRSCGGLVPVYYADGERRTVIATRLEYMARFGAYSELDPLMNAIWAGGGAWAPAGRTLLRDVAIVPRGSFYRSSRGAARVGRYWDPRPEREADLIRDDDRPRQLRELLTAGLDRFLAHDANVLALSGGVDSAVLAAVAVKAVRRPIAALTLLPPDDELRARDLRYLDSLAREITLERHWRLVLTPEVSMRMTLEVPRVVHHVAHPVLQALPDVLSEYPAPVFFGGEFADEVAGARATLPDYFALTSLISLGKSFRRLPSGSRDYLRWMRVRAGRSVGRPRTYVFSELADLVRPALRAEYAELVRDRVRATQRGERPLEHLSLLYEIDGFIPQSWELASHLGVRRYFPFATRELVEFALRSHPGDLVGPGFKRPFREGLRDLVPGSNLDRGDKGGWETPSIRRSAGGRSPSPRLSARSCATTGCPLHPARFPSRTPQVWPK
jgi:asparagine synthetase B (glutamine-hydrolysing)